MLALALIFALSMLSVNIFAMEKRPTWPEGVIQAFYADEGATRNDAWIDRTERIIRLPVGTEFDGGNANHGAYHYYSDFEEGDVFYVHWVVRVLEYPDAEGEIIMSQDPAYLKQYTGKGQGEVEVGTTGGLIDPDTSEVYYEDLTPNEWTVLSYGFEVPFPETKHVQHRIHFKNKAPIEIKYLIVTTEDITSLTCDPKTGEIDGITNDNSYVAPTPTPTPEPTPTPDKTDPPQSQAAASPSASTGAGATEAPGENNEGADLTVILIIVAAAVVIIGGVIVYLVIKNKKK